MFTFSIILETNVILIINKQQLLGSIVNEFILIFLRNKIQLNRIGSFFWPYLKSKPLTFVTSKQCDQKKSPIVYKSCPKMNSVEKRWILTPLQKWPKNVGDLGKLLLTKALKSCPKYNK